MAMRRTRSAHEYHSCTDTSVTDPYSRTVLARGSGNWEHTPMPRIRTLKPEHRQHRKVGPLSDREYRLWVSMILEAEDSGRLVCDATQLRAVTWPYHPRVSAAHVEAAIQGLACTGMIRLYEHHGVRYADFLLGRSPAHRPPGPIQAPGISALCAASRRPREYAGKPREYAGERKWKWKWKWKGKEWKGGEARWPGPRASSRMIRRPARGRWPSPRP